MPAKDDFEPFVLPGQRLCLDLDWCEKAPTRWGCRWKSRGIRAVGVCEYGNVMVWVSGKMPTAFVHTDAPITSSLQQVVSKILKQRPPLCMSTTCQVSHGLLFRLDVLMLSWCWGCYYILLFFDLIFFCFVDSILAMYLWLFVRNWSVPLPSNRAWLRHVTAKMSVWAPFVVCRHADVGHTRLSFHTQKRSDLKAGIIFLKHP